jgi:lysozyme
MRMLLTAICCILLGYAGLSLYRMGVIQFNDLEPNRFPVIGIDVSHHQGPIDWHAVAAAGIAFSYIKSTEGRDFLDPQFTINWTATMEAGVPRGAYHFFTFCSPGAAQAEHFLSVVPPSPEALTPVADIEFVGNCTAYTDLLTVRDELRIFLAAVEQAWGRKPILYLTPDSLDRVPGSELTGYPVWIRSVFSEPDPDAYRGWLLWQFSDNSRVPGISGPVDRNALRPGLSLNSLGWPRNTAVGITLLRDLI